MAITYSKQMLIERIKRFLANGFPKSSFSISDNEILLDIDADIPFVMKGAMFENAKITGVLDVPEAYLITYQYTLTLQNKATREWYVTLAQPPLELPTGYDITNIYFSDITTGRSQNVYFITAKRNAYRNEMPKPEGVFARIVGQVMYLQATNGMPLSNGNLNVQMPISRTNDLNAPMNMPDGAIQSIFERSTKRLSQRYMMPQDIIKDNLPAGDKKS